MHIYDSYLIHFVKMMDSACNTGGVKKRKGRKIQILYSIRVYIDTKI